jgi:FkbM family methyltransferase
VILDVGANIGVYSLLAAGLAGPGGHVYACEPHAATLADLLTNVGLNGFTDRVSVLSCALGEAPGTVPFDYRSLEGASALSQLGGGDFVPAATELKAVMSIDALIAGGTLRPPALVKIDVDGGELDVLRGMRELLTGPDAPRSVQVEIHASAIAELLADAGYRLVDRHVSAGAADHAAHANGIFEL